LEYGDGGLSDGVAFAVTWREGRFGWVRRWYRLWR